MRAFRVGIVMKFGPSRAARFTLVDTIEQLPIQPKEFRYFEAWLAAYTCDVLPAKLEVPGANLVLEPVSNETSLMRDTIRNIPTEAARKVNVWDPGFSYSPSYPLQKLCIRGKLTAWGHEQDGVEPVQESCTPIYIECQQLGTRGMDVSVYSVKWPFSSDGTLHKYRTELALLDPLVAEHALAVARAIRQKWGGIMVIDGGQDAAISGKPMSAAGDIVDPDFDVASFEEWLEDDVRVFSGSASGKPYMRGSLILNHVHGVDSERAGGRTLYVGFVYRYAASKRKEETGYDTLRDLITVEVSPRTDGPGVHLSMVCNDRGADPHFADLVDRVKGISPGANTVSVGNAPPARAKGRRSIKANEWIFEQHQKKPNIPVADHAVEYAERRAKEHCPVDKGSDVLRLMTSAIDYRKNRRQKTAENRK